MKKVRVEKKFYKNVIKMKFLNEGRKMFEIISGMF